MHGEHQPEKDSEIFTFVSKDADFCLEPHRYILQYRLGTTGTGSQTRFDLFFHWRGLVQKAASFF